MVLTEVKKKIPQVKPFYTLLLLCGTDKCQLRNVLTSSCEATLFKLNSSPDVLLLGPTDSVCLAGTAEGFGEQCPENGAALLHGCLRCCVCDGDRPPIPRENRRRAPGSALVLPHWFTADGPADFKHRSQGIMLQICSFVHYAKNVFMFLSLKTSIIFWILT